MAARGKGEGGRRSLNFNVGILGHIDSGKTSLGMLCKHLHVQHQFFLLFLQPKPSAQLRPLPLSTKTPRAEKEGSLWTSVKKTLSLPSVTKLCLCLSFSLPKQTGFSSFSMPVPAHLEGTSSSLKQTDTYGMKAVCVWRANARVTGM